MLSFCSLSFIWNKVYRPFNPGQFCQGLINKWHFQLEASLVIKKNTSMLVLPHSNPNCKNLPLKLTLNFSLPLCTSGSPSSSFSFFFSELHLTLTFSALAYHFDWRASADEPKSGSQVATPAHRCRSAILPAVRRVDENKDLHILMSKTPWHLWRGLAERKERRRRRRWGTENGEEGGVGFIRYQFSWYSSGIC